jgi:hypothetical protein
MAASFASSSFVMTLLDSSIFPQGRKRVWPGGNLGRRFASNNEAVLVYSEQMGSLGLLLFLPEDFDTWPVVLAVLSS